MDDIKIDYLEECNELKSYIKDAYQKTIEQLNPNIYRGHLRSISTDIEDGIALFVSSILPESKILLDSSIHVDGKNNRPDLLVVNKDNEVEAMIEIKANMGWCRNAKWVIDNIVSNDEKFKKVGTLLCEFSHYDNMEVKYGDNVKLYLIALTDGNCTQKNHQANKEYATTTKVKQFNLFSGWYDALYNLEIEDFIESLL